MRDRISTFIFFTLLWLSGPVAWSQTDTAWRDPGKLTIMQENYPRVFYFRQPERTGNYFDFKDWEDAWDDLMGIEGKVLNEELADRNKLHIKYFERFKSDNPDQLVLLHYNGNACDPKIGTRDFFDGHWLYTNGTLITEDLPENWTYSTVRVEDASYFALWTGRFFSKKEDVAIVALDADGNPDWNHCEQAIIRNVDYGNNTLTIARGAYNDTPLSFKAGKARIVAHVIEGPWGVATGSSVGGNNLLWYYNHSSTCPRDKQGRDCNDVIAELMAKRFMPGGDLYHFDGFELDVLWYTLWKNSYFYLQNLGYGKKRAPDCNGDGIADMGVIEGINVYEKGIDEFTHKMRDALDKVDKNILFLADGELKNQRGFGVLNGIETEGYEHATGDYFNWSDLLNMHCFWNANSAPENFSYLNHKVKHATAWSFHRLAFSIAMYAGSAISQLTSPPANPDGSTAVFDEFVKGTENRLGWMGPPMGDAIHMVDSEKNLLTDDTPSKKLLKQFKLVNCKAEVTKRGIKLEALDSVKYMKILIPEVSLPEHEFTLVMRTAADPKAGFGPEYGRQVFVRPTDQDGNSLLNDNEWWIYLRDRRFSYMNVNPFTNYFYFPDTRLGKVNVEISFEGHEAVYINEIKLFAAPDAMYRKFEHALVISNPSLHNYTFDLSKITPGEHYRRLKGSVTQDTETNNGRPVESRITLEKHDALFLVKDEATKDLIH